MRKNLCFPLISIIMPVYNAEKHLEASLNSLLGQTFKNIEILCVNDGSKDSSLDILNKFAHEDERIKVFSQQNSGPARARNVGLENAQGKYLMFCDADDSYEPIMCEEMLNAIQDSDFDFVICDANIIEKDSNHGRPQTSINYHKLKYKGAYNLTAWQKLKTNVVLWNKIYKMSLIKKYNITFPEGFECDDSSFNWQYLCYSKKMYALDKKLYNYNLFEDSVMGRIYLNKKSKKIFDRVYAMDFTLKKVISNDALIENIWLFKAIEDGILWANAFLGEDIVLEYLKKVNKYLLTNFNVSDLSDFELLVSCKKKKYKNIIEKYCKNLKAKRTLIIKKDFGTKVKYYFAGIPVFKIKYTQTCKKYYFLGLQYKTKPISNVTEVHNKLNQLESKFAMYYLKQRLFNPIDIPEDKKYIVCFDCLYDKNQECIDAYTIFQYLQNNNIPSKYVVLKNAKLMKEIQDNDDVFVVNDRYHFLFEYAHIIQCSKAILTSFGLYSDLNKILKYLPYTDYIFIDHGVLLLKKWVIELYNNKFFNKVLVTTKLTKNLYLERKNWDENQMIFSGLPRWDKLKRENRQKNNEIFVFFTWRNTFYGNPQLAGSYLKNVINFIEELRKNIDKSVNISVAWHHELRNNKVALCEKISDGIKIMPTENISEIINNADMLITDYSSVWSDFMYQNKPVVFYRFDNDELYLNDRDQSASIDAMQEDDNLYNCFYDKDEAINKIKFYVQNDFVLEPCNKKINEDIFWNVDSNCEEIYKQIIQMH